MTIAEALQDVRDTWDANDIDAELGGFAGRLRLWGGVQSGGLGGLRIGSLPRA